MTFDEVRSPRVLVLFGHPAFHKSKNHRAMKEALVASGLAEVRDLYVLYPDMMIDIDAEQEALKRSDILVFQHPFFWYSTPALFKDYVDLVLEYGFAYGEGGTQLKGKFWAHAITTGGPDESYQPGGYNRFTISQLLAPWDQTAYLCGCLFQPPFVWHKAHDSDPQRLQQLQTDYLKYIEQIKEKFLATRK